MEESRIESYAKKIYQSDEKNKWLMKSKTSFIFHEQQKKRNEKENNLNPIFNWPMCCTVHHPKPCV